MATDTLTGRLLGRIRTEMKTSLHGESHDTAFSVENYRPDRIHLENDGVWHYWLVWNSPPVIHVQWDGAGWRAYSRDWGNGDPHTYHLAGPTGWVDHLPTLEGIVTLDQRFRYELRTLAGLPAAWDLYEIAVD